MGNVTKKGIIEEISRRTGLTQVDTKIIIESFLNAICRSLENRRNIEIRGFGRFKIKEKKARLARNPRTGEQVKVEAGLKPVFEASKELRKKVNGGIKSVRLTQDNAGGQVAGQDASGVLKNSSVAESSNSDQN